MLATIATLLTLNLGGQPTNPALLVRFCPQTVLRNYPLDDVRGIQSLVVHNIAVVNRGPARVEIGSVVLQLLRAGSVIDERRLAGEEIERFGAAGRRLQGSGALTAYAFQFCGTSLIEKEVLLGGPALEPSQALLVTQQSFAFNGARDELRVLVRGNSPAGPVEAAGSIRISDSAQTAYRFPLSGLWFVAAGPSLHSHHRWGTMEAFALDIVKVDDQGTTGRSARQRFADFYAYGADVLAAAAGRVVAALDHESEDPGALRRPTEDAVAYFKRLTESQATRVAGGARAITGNYVSIAHPGGAYSHYMHLQPGSVRVHVGETVASGQIVGKLGSSGNSTEPHLHFQVCDGPSPLECAGMPVTFEGVTLPLADLPRPLQTGDFVRAR